MAVDIYDSQYLLILLPALVIALMFLFFWLFMKETSYDEVLAKQKRDLRPTPSKPDVRRKGDKKKGRKKEGGGGGGGSGSGGGDSEEELREFDVADAPISVVAESEEEAAPLAPPTPPPLSLLSAAPPEAPSGLRERRKKEKKAAKAAAATPPPPPPPPREEPEVNGSKAAGRRAEQPLPSSKQASAAPSAQPEIQVQAQVQVQAQAPPTQTPPQTSGKKKDKKKQKADAADDHQPEAKVEQTPAPVVKKEAPLAAESRAQDGLPQNASSGKKKNSAKKQKTEHVEESFVQPDSAAPANHQASHNDDVPSKGSGKKQKVETNKESAEVKLKELLSGLASLSLTEAEALGVLALLREKSPSALDAWQKMKQQSTAKADPAVQERERLLGTLQEEASIAKDKVKQLSQELQAEKQKTCRAEAVVREQRAAMEKEVGALQAKAQASYQEVQMKYQQVREQLEGQITRLQQENGILRDAVSSATNQMESKNSAELNKLRSEYAGLMKELAESSNKLQQEEHQRKSLEVGYKQSVSQLEAQLQESKRRWDDLQNYLLNVNTEREQLQAAKQELQGKLLALDTEKNKELQSLHGSLTEAVVSKERLEQKVRQLLEAQHSMPDEALHGQVQELLNENKALHVQNESLQVKQENLQAQITSQATHVSHFEELQKLLAEKELQRKSLEDSLNAERSSGASRETNMQAMHNENMALKAEIHSLQAQISEQSASQHNMDEIHKRVQEKDESIRTIEGLLEKGLIEMANKEEALTAVREENEALQREVAVLKHQAAEHTSSESMLDELQREIQDKDEKLKLMEGSMKTAQDSHSAREKTNEALEHQLVTLQAEAERLRQKAMTEEQCSAVALLPDLKAQLSAKDQQIQLLRVELETRTFEVSEKVEQLQQQQARTEAPSPELLAALSEKERQVYGLQSELAELRDSLELHRKKNNELREKNWSAMEALSATESMLQGKLSKAVKENQTALQSSQATCRDVLHRLLPHVPLPSEQNHQEWLHRFEKAVAESSAAQSSSTPASAELEVMAEKLKESEEAQRVLQKDCETYKKVLAETEGILQRLQSSVEEEESRWKVKLEVSQGELREMSTKVTALEQEVERLGDGAELENLKREKQQLESELEKAERESATYVTEVRELKELLTELQSKLDGSHTETVRQSDELNLLKTQLTKTLAKLEKEESERQKVAGDLYKAQQSLDLIQEELSKETGNADLIQNSSISSQTEAIDRKEKMTAGLHQTVRELQHLLQAVNLQLTKGQEGEADKDMPEV